MRHATISVVHRGLRIRLVLVLMGVLLPIGGTAADEGLLVEAKARALQPGELIVLTITARSESPASPTVQIFGRNIPVIPFPAPTTAGTPATSGARAWRALIGVDLGVKPGSYTASVTLHDGQRLLAARHPLLIAPKRFETRTLRVNPAFVEPPASERARIAREAARLRAIWTMSEPAARWTEPFVRPVPDPANSRFGSRSIFNGRARSPHTGADFASASGTLIKAPNAGRVLLAQALYFSGNTVVIDHGLGLFSLFAHLSAFDVQEGDEVAPGAPVGRVGATGRVTGPHLHWAVRASGARIDPLSLLAVLGDP